MKIGVFCGGYPPDRAGGAQYTCEHLVNGLRKKGHEVWVITPHFGKNIDDPWVVQFRVPAPAESEALHYAAWTLCCWWFLLRNRFDMCCGHQIWGYLACLASPRAQKWTLTVHNILVPYKEWLDHFPHRAHYEIFKWAARKAGKVIAISRHLSQDILAHVPEARNKIEVVYSCVDTEVFKKAAVRKGERKVVLYLAKLKPQKGIMEILEAYRIIRRTRPDIELVVRGICSPAYFEWLKGTCPEATWIGKRLRRAEIIEWYSRADVYVVYAPASSADETFCLSLVEAMACELPAVCSDIPIYREIGQGKLFYVEPENPEKLAEKIVEVLGRPDLPEVGRRMREIARSYSVENNVQGYERVFGQLALKGGKGT